MANRPGPKPVNTDPTPVYRSYPQSARSRLTIDRVVRLVLWAGGIALTIWLIWFFSTLVIFLVVGVVLAYLMKPLVDRFQGLGLGRIFSILVTFVLVIGGLVLLITKLAPLARDQLADISEQVTFHTAAQITAVDPESPADEGGLAPGDAIVSVDGENWEGFSHLQSVLHAKEGRDSLRLIVEDRFGDRRAVTVAVHLPKRDQEVSQIVTDDEDERYLARIGVTAQEVTLSNVALAIERRIRRVIPIERGVIVSGIAIALNKIFGEDRLTQIVGSVVGIFTNIFYAVLVIPFVAFFFLKDGPQIRRGLLRLVPNRYFELTLTLVEKIESNIGRYFMALFFQLVAVSLVASVLLYVVGLQYAVAVGIFTGLANTIPYFGPFMGFLVGTIVGVVQTGDFSLVPGVVIAMIITQAADNTVFQPYIFSRAAQSHPLLILFAVLIGAQIGGIVGMLIAIPVMTIVRVTIEQLLWGLRNYRILKVG